MLKFYTRLQNKKVFEWIMNKIKNKIPKLQLPKRKVIQRKKLSNFTKEKVWEKA